MVKITNKSNSLPKPCEFFNPWSNEDLPPITLKHLSQNLTNLQRQYHLRSACKQISSKRHNKKPSSISTSYLQNKENDSLLHLFQNKHVLDLRRIEKKRSNSFIRSIEEQLTSQKEQSWFGRKYTQGKDFCELRGLLPLQGRQDYPFLSKQKAISISKAVNLSRLRGRTPSKGFASGMEEPLQVSQNLSFSFKQKVMKQF